MNEIAMSAGTYLNDRSRWWFNNYPDMLQGMDLEAKEKVHLYDHDYNKVLPGETEHDRDLRVTTQLLDITQVSAYKAVIDEVINVHYKGLELVLIKAYGTLWVHLGWFANASGTSSPIIINTARNKENVISFTVPRAVDLNKLPSGTFVYAPHLNRLVNSNLKPTIDTALHIHSYIEQHKELAALLLNAPKYPLVGSDLPVSVLKKEVARLRKVEQPKRKKKKMESEDGWRESLENEIGRLNSEVIETNRLLKQTIDNMDVEIRMIRAEIKKLHEEFTPTEIPFNPSIESTVNTTLDIADLASKGVESISIKFKE